jgi:signal transduction histidine kinase
MGRMSTKGRAAWDAASALASRALRRARAAVAAPRWPLMSALLLGFAALVETLIRAGSPTESDGSTALLLNLLATVPLALRRRRLPVVAGVVTAATIVVVSGSAQWTVAGLAGQLWVLYLVAATYPRRVALLLSVPFLLNGIAPFGGRGTLGPSLALAVLAVVALVLGDGARTRGEAVAERDAARRVVAETLRDRAVMEERARIAREMHDLVAHHVSMIAVHAETARLATPGMPEEGRERLTVIGDTARATLAELRRLLGVLRAGMSGDPERAPQPGLAQLGALLESARAAGTPVRLTVHGQPVPLPAGVDLSAYRIVQEALTNARRHAPGASVEIELRFGGGFLRLRVHDSGARPASGPRPASAPATGGAAGAAAAGGMVGPGETTGEEFAPGPAPEAAAGASIGNGHGLLGMRERAALVGGDLRAGPAPGGGFTVEADLPIADLPSGQAS